MIQPQRRGFIDKLNKYIDGKLEKRFGKKEEVQEKCVGVVLMRRS
jgi:hypothetical protein